MAWHLFSSGVLMSQNTNDQGRKGYHSKSEMRRIEHMKEHAKPDAPTRVWMYMGRFISSHGTEYAILDGPKIEAGGDKFELIERSAYDALAKELSEAKKNNARYEQRFAKANDLSDQLASAQSRVAELEQDLIVRLADCHQYSKERDVARAEIERVGFYKLECEDLARVLDKRGSELTAAQARIAELEAENLELSLKAPSTLRKELTAAKAEIERLKRGLK